MSVERESAEDEDDSVATSATTGSGAGVISALAAILAVIVSTSTLALASTVTTGAASRASPRPGTPDRESGTPRAVRAITAASRSSVLASPANRPAARLAASPGRWATPSPAARARLTAGDPMLRNWSTTTSVPPGAVTSTRSPLRNPLCLTRIISLVHSAS